MRLCAVVARIVHLLRWRSLCQSFSRFSRARTVPNRLHDYGRIRFDEDGRMHGPLPVDHADAPFGFGKANGCLTIKLAC